MKPTGKLAYAYKTISELEAQLAALKEENERLKDELAERQKYILSLEARVEELEGALKQYADDYNWCYDTCNISRDIAKAALKEPANEG